MKLSVSNPYMRNRALRERSVFRSVATSSAIEGIHAPFEQMARKAAKQSPPTTKRASRS